MKEYLKSELKHIPLVLILFILFYGITTLATTTLFNSNEVKYNNTTSNIQSDNVQGAIDELYACASNYGAYNTRLTNAEATIGTGTLNTTAQNLIGGVNELNGKLTTSPWTAQYFYGAYNVDDFTTPGLYFLRGTISNAPYGTNGHLIVMTAGEQGWRKQIWIRYGTSGSNDNRIYVRGEKTNSWGVWVEYDGSFVTN